MVFPDSGKILSGRLHLGLLTLQLLKPLLQIRDRLLLLLLLLQEPA